MMDWYGNVVWEYIVNNDEETQHHDFKFLPNGNILYLGWEKVEAEELETLGKTEIFSTGIWTEFVKEIKPLCETYATEVWSWHMKDHLIQDVYPDLDNYGLIAENPGKIDINYVGPFTFDYEDQWHANSIDYYPERDEIVINCRSNGEFWIIDHSTSTEEAASTEGGNSGKGGEILFRYGNNYAHGVGATDDPKFFGAHGASWIPAGLPQEGYILIFNNGYEREPDEYSTIEIVLPQFDDSGAYVLNDDGSFAVADHQIVYGAEQEFLSRYRSNAQRLPNGYLINSGDTGNIFEINDDGEVSWEIKQCDIEDGWATDCLAPNYTPNVFRAYSYPIDFAGFDGKNLQPILAAMSLPDFVPCEAPSAITNPNAFPVSLKVHTPNAYTCCTGEIIPKLRLFNLLEDTSISSVTYQLQYDDEEATEYSWSGSLDHREEDFIELDPIPFDAFNELKVCLLSVNEGAIEVAEDTYCHTAINYCNVPLAGISQLNVRIDVFPNPTSGEIKINLVDGLLGSNEVLITDLQGKVLLQQNFDGANSILLPDGWKNGIYLVSVLDEGKASTRKFILLR